MIEIKINNCAEIAKSKSVIAKLLPHSVLQGMVEKAVAKKVEERLAQEGLEAVVVVSKQ
ncbi:MAG: hypothetical protein V3V31_13670 [Methylococcales bacterium]